jgi:hypothetical protein
MKTHMGYFLMSNFVPDPAETHGTILERFIRRQLGSKQVQVAMMAKVVLFCRCIASLSILKNSKEFRPDGGNHMWCIHTALDATYAIVVLS